MPRKFRRLDLSCNPIQVETITKLLEKRMRYLQHRYWDRINSPTGKSKFKEEYFQLKELMREQLSHGEII